MMCLPRSASASCSCVIRPESSLTADCTRFAASSCNRARGEASRCHPRYRCVDCRNPSPHCGRRVRMSRACLSTKSSGEFDQDRQIRGVRISVHVYLTDKRAAAQVVYVACAAGSNWMNHGTFGELLCHLTTGTRQRDWRPDTDPSVPKYPRLPIIERSVHEPKFANNASDC